MNQRNTSSFRRQLAGRFTLAMAVALCAVMVIGYLALRETLDRQIDATILSVASIQAASVTDDPTGEMQFHEWDLTPGEIPRVKRGKCAIRAATARGGRGRGAGEAVAAPLCKMSGQGRSGLAGFVSRNPPPTTAPVTLSARS